MSININTINKEGRTDNISINNYPDECPICHCSISPVIQYPHAYHNSNYLQIPLRCPRIACQELFIANYEKFLGEFVFRNCQPVAKIKKEFNSVIENISKNFCLIYNQSLSAEKDGLTEICGGGYRRSLEFLIKDYLIKINPEKEDEIKGKFLGKCISENIKNDNIKNVAKRATWLGNDETHYLRIWKDKDLKDLKKLIDLTVHWIEMEELTKEAIKDMPEEVDTGNKG